MMALIHTWFSVLLKADGPSLASLNPHLNKLLSIFPNTSVLEPLVCVRSRCATALIAECVDAAMEDCNDRALLPACWECINLARTVINHNPSVSLHIASTNASFQTEEAWRTAWRTITSTAASMAPAE